MWWEGILPCFVFDFPIYLRLPYFGSWHACLDQSKNTLWIYDMDCWNWGVTLHREQSKKSTRCDGLLEIEVMAHGVRTLYTRTVQAIDLDGPCICVPYAQAYNVIGSHCTLDIFKIYFCSHFRRRTKDHIDHSTMYSNLRQTSAIQGWLSGQPSS